MLPFFLPKPNCLNPLLIKNKRYKDASPDVLRWYADEYFDGGHIERGKPDDFYINVPCGKCRLCIEKRRKEWVFRILNEFDKPTSGLETLFFTWTFRDDFLDNPEFDPRASIRKYLDNCRKHFGNKRFKFFIVGEYGKHNTERLHFHGLIFHLPRKAQKMSFWWSKWKYGRLDVQVIRKKDACPVYLAKYLSKDFGDKDSSLCKLMVSNGFGLSYLTDYTVSALRESQQRFGTYGLKKFPLSRYYTSRVFDIFDSIDFYNRWFNIEFQGFRVGIFDKLSYMDYIKRLPKIQNYYGYFFNSKNCQKGHSSLQF